ncbi:hypothetical protein DQE82_30180 [Micromonospora sp. LHW51205]|uniref:hypothetical protein n=1 Tax=Micromonospora sp. LHW51205 TaxID=2248752 RepID=UPI000DE89A59|nr:hypothetical protein [Micromonospora sp. LHW51205]RBQ03885.1 hypothetical protein DQE82_30180 [Micromonospora sp. LHW51205]
MGKRKATEQDLANIVAEWAVRQIHNTDASRAAFRNLSPEAQGQIHGWAADERQRRADGITITD